MTYSEALVRTALVVLIIVAVVVLSAAFVIKVESTGSPKFQNRMLIVGGVALLSMVFTIPGLVALT